jgi:chemotaxis protein methyltransferase CheR
LDDQQFKTILCSFGLSFQGYRKVRKGVKKRLIRHMRGLGCKMVPDYLERIRNNSEVMHECRLALTVSISRFFRDKMVWDIIRKKVLPDLAEKNYKPIHIWSAGCARGEEVYSMKMLWEGVEKEGLNLPGLRFLASDINSEYLVTAQNGIYGKTSLKEVCESDKKTFFHTLKNGKQFIVKPFLRNDITWQVMDLCTELPNQSFDLIFLRNNVLTYLDGNLKELVFQNIVKKLNPGGFLVKGAHETIPETEVSLVRAYDQANILIKS